MAGPLWRGPARGLAMMTGCVIGRGRLAQSAAYCIQNTRFILPYIRLFVFCSLCFVLSVFLSVDPLLLRRHKRHAHTWGDYFDDSIVNSPPRCPTSCTRSRRRRRTCCTRLRGTTADRHIRQASSKPLSLLLPSPLRRNPLLQLPTSMERRRAPQVEPRPVLPPKLQVLQQPQPTQSQRIPPNRIPP